VGNDPTIGGPARVAARAGPFLTERSHNTDSRYYKGGQRRVARLTVFMRAMRAFAHAGRAAWSDRVGKIAWRLASSHQQCQAILPTLRARQ